MSIAHRVFATLLPLLLASMCGCVHRDPAASAQVLLLGETHDNGEGHRLRATVLRERVELGWRPAIAMEQFDREHQGLLDAALRECPDADCVVQRAAPGPSGWTWTFYRPVIDLALKYKLPLLAANLSRTDAGKVVRSGLASALDASVMRRYGLDGPVSPDVLKPQVEEVRRGHCDMLPADMLQPMALAQIARDVVMAETMRPHIARGVVLIAGNGHVRRDIAVPYWLHTQGVPTWSIGFVEQAGARNEFDVARGIPRLDRPDPCIGLGGKLGTTP